jgi:hypothetical protein
MERKAQCILFGSQHLDARRLQSVAFAIVVSGSVRPIAIGNIVKSPTDRIELRAFAAGIFKMRFGGRIADADRKKAKIFCLRVVGEKKQTPVVMPGTISGNRQATMSPRRASGKKIDLVPTAR